MKEEGINDDYLQDNETLAEVEARIRSLYDALIRAELKAHFIRKTKSIEPPHLV